MGQSCIPGAQVRDDEDGVEIKADTVQVEVPEPEPVGWVLLDGEEQFLRPRTWNLQHQKIWVRFDFEEKAVLGVTELLLTSISSSNEQLILDSKTTTIHQIKDIVSGDLLSFEKDSATVTIPLPQVYATDDTLIIRLEYTAHPPQRGLYFVNADGSDADKPTQVWTLGQPEDNSFWLPTIDHPAERTTQETWISVPDRFTTLSNGALIDSRVLEGDSLRTDYWYMDKPHAPYLIVLAAGEYEVVEEYRHGVILRYYVEPQYAPYVSSIYRDTDDMLEYFTRKLQVPYPWGIYAQAPVHDFIASGMENTTATLLFNRVQVTDRQALDVEYQDLIAHELIHQWFGNLVTCKDWANLPMNEGFANYFETLYREHKNGRDAAAWKHLSDQATYFAEAETYRRPVIFNRYSEPEDMYDRHTYEKAGQIFRMLHHEVGDTHWWGALNRFLQEHAYTAIDWMDVRNAFEQQTGELKRTFFHQWLMEPGHPEFEIRQELSGRDLLLHVRQVQDTLRQPVFHVSMDIHYTNDIGETNIRTVHIDRADTVFVFDNSSGKLGDVVADPHRILLAEYVEELDYFDIISRLAHPSVALRNEALKAIRPFAADTTDLQRRDVVIDALKDVYAFESVPQFREEILRTLLQQADSSETWRAFIHNIDHTTESWFRSRIRAAARSAQLFGTTDNQYLEILLEDPSYYVEQFVLSQINNE